jgi:hypothetical protein
MYATLLNLTGSAIALLLLCSPLVQADIFTWTDAQGRVHYGDRPPADSAARPLDPDQANVSTIGGAALRSEERELLTQIDQRRAEAQRAAAQRAALAPIIINPPAAPEPQPATRTIIRYPVPYPYYSPRRTTGLGLDLSTDHWRLQFERQIHHHTRRPVPYRPYPHREHEGRKRHRTETEIGRDAPSEHSRPPSRYRPQATRLPG